ncbi:DNA-processing protein DprA [Cellvibrio japonicus]|uniref:Smf protein n=1 Tax=Cellvibrio japonicus (strain Ueda107) TaxID=498211 RepID=B3PGY9_CELJU|nr:DNA-processing protein DprA [Cellvibrio japonicus]ACE84311.1 smf protein [Cellvibrio japonicus Ueda107]QEI13791.1 DNA-protecting protein DprA [Cellvibrio japonicus]QEI17365.1 DNA-protecting protein DprA [Cellvibrio japonicus]QEI20941.1 DNA-protecting protein DprA [Cellvibrio japonicus]
MATSLNASLLILRLPETGTVTYWKLVDHFGSPEAALNQPAPYLEAFLRPQALQALEEYRRHPANSALAQKVAGDLEQLDANPDIHCLPLEHELYPELLRQIPNPPPLLFVRGDPGCLGLPQLAIVGSRNPTRSGTDNARHFAAYLAERGFTITSGLALGIDAAAHRGALEASGKTVAVMGTGIDRIYPGRHRTLAQQIIAQGGALVSEFPLGTSSHAGNFPQRNRLISGLSLGSLIVEAAVQSGSLITASFALQQNREVFAIPGSIHNPLARGCHQLIRQGAKLVETGDDIVEELDGLLGFHRQQLQRSAVKQVQPLPTASTNMPLAELDPAATQLLEAMGYDPVNIDTLVERTSLDAGIIAAQLVSLELSGAICTIAGGYLRVPNA